jgi:DNA-binding XRE family transcriptional regulator
MNLGQPFWSLIKYWRTSRDLTRADLAQRVGCSVKTIEKIESGERRPSKLLASLLAQHLGIPVEDRENFVRLARGVDISDQGAAGLVGGPAMTGLIGNMLKTAPAHPVPHASQNLPIYSDSFIGRTAEVAALSVLLLQSGARLLSVIGSPGIGKTRLAVEVARTVSAHMWDNAFFLDLTSVPEPSMLAAAMGSALGLREIEGETITDRVSRYFQSRQILLFLDGVTQRAGVSRFVTHLMAVAPYLKVVVTGRVPLGLVGECSYRVPPLALPSPGVDPGLADLLKLDSARLFRERVLEADPDFILREGAAPLLVELLCLTAGVPRRIERAAALAPTMSMLALLEEMADGD